MGLIPSTLRQENKVIFGLSYERLIIVILAMTLASSLTNYITDPRLGIPFMIFSVAVALLLTSRDFVNPGRSKLKAIMVIIKYYTSLKIYHSIQTIRFQEYLENRTGEMYIDEIT